MCVFSMVSNMCGPNMMHWSEPYLTALQQGLHRCLDAFLHLKPAETGRFTSVLMITGYIGNEIWIFLYILTLFPVLILFFVKSLP